MIGVRGTPDGLPLAQARNAGARHALDAGAELLVFLDVDCIPGAGAAARATRRPPPAEPALLCGPVAYLPPAPRGGYPATGLHALADAAPRAARPAGGRRAQRGGDHALFWTLSFAVTRDHVAPGRRVLRGLRRLRRRGHRLRPARRAAPASISPGSAAPGPTTSTIRPQSPPVQHLDDILRNAAIFHRRWGWWPMERLAHRVRRARPRAPRPGRRPMGPGHDRLDRCVCAPGRRRRLTSCWSDAVVRG